MLNILRYGVLPSPRSISKIAYQSPARIKTSNTLLPIDSCTTNQTKEVTQERKKARKVLAESIDFGVYFDPDSYISNCALDCIGKHDLSHVYTL